METNICLVYCSVPDEKVAKKLATFLVTSHLAACVKQFPKVMTTYEWDGQLEQTYQTLLLIKTTLSALDRLKETILEHHPDSCPEIVSCPVTHGHEPYLRWIEKQIILKDSTQSF